MPPKASPAQLWITKPGKIGRNDRVTRAPLHTRGLVIHTAPHPDDMAAIVATDATTGRTRWQIPFDVYAKPPKGALPLASNLSGWFAADDERLFVPTSKTLHAFALATGKLSWTAPTPYEQHSTSWTHVIVRDGAAWLVRGASLVEVDVATGKVRRRFVSPREKVLMAGLQATRTHALVHALSRMWAIDFAKPKAAAWTATPNRGYDAIAHDDLFVVGDDDDKRRTGLRAFDAKTGKPRWFVACGRITSMVAHRETIIAKNTEAELVCLEAATGKIRWRSSARVKPIARGESHGELVVGDDLVFSVNRDGARRTLVSIVDVATGESRGTIAGSAKDPFSMKAAPAFGDGKLFVHTELALAAYGSRRA